MKRSFHLRKIRKRLNDAFDDPELTAFCHDCFLPVYDKFARGMQKDEKISLLLAHCRRHPTRVQALFSAIREEVELYPYRRDVLSPLIESLEAYLKHLASSEVPPLGDKQTLTVPTETSYQQDQVIADPEKITSQKAAPVAPSPPVLEPVERRSLAPSPDSASPEKRLGIGSERICPKDGMVQVYVPAGKFLMGSRADDPDAWDHEKPQHEVYLDAYWIDKTPVTNAMFAKFVQERGYMTQAERAKDKYTWRTPRGSGSNLTGKDNHPVVCISWNDAIAYAAWAGRRLPTEAEWEKAAGGTDGRKWPWGNNPPTKQFCNFDMNVGDTTPVDNYLDGASPYGALNMVGNVWEWCYDTYSANYYACSPKANRQGSQFLSKFKVLRGGSWWNTVPDSRVRDRIRSFAHYRDEFRGFRCAQSDS